MTDVGKLLMVRTLDARGGRKKRYSVFMLEVVRFICAELENKGLFLCLNSSKHVRIDLYQYCLQCSVFLQQNHVIL